MVAIHKKRKKSSNDETALTTSKKAKKDNGFGSKVMNVFSKLSKAFLLPIALLPIAGVFLGVGAAISSNAASGSGLWYFGTVLNKMGDVAFGNLPILFAISTALAFSRDSGIAAITAVVGFLVMNGIQAALLHNNHVGTPQFAVIFQEGKYHWIQAGADGKFPTDDLLGNWQFYYVPGGGTIPTDGETLIPPVGGIRVDGSGNKMDDAGKLYYNLLWVKDVPNGLITANIGVTSLNTGVLAGIFVGAIAAWSFNKFNKTQLPAAISFFSGTKLVPIIAFFLVIPLSFIFIFVWPWIGIGLAKFGQVSGKLPIGLDSFIFEIVERSLVPFGLHHVFYAPLWWTNAGGSIAEAFTNPSFTGGWDQDKWVEEYNKVFGGSGTWQSIVSIIAARSDLWEAMGDQTMMYKVIANTDIINYTMLEHLGLNLGRFQSGKFGFMLLGLPMAAMAMWLTVPKKNRKSVMGIYFSAAFTCFLTGITEPIEYTFLFLAPWLFYGVHMPLAAVSFLLSGLMKTHVSMTVSGGIIDYIVFGLIPFFGSKAMNWLSVFGILFVAVGMAVLYFFAFFFAVKYGKVMVPGREDASGDTKLFTKADYKGKDGPGDNTTGGGTMSPWTTSTNKGEIAKYEKAAAIVAYLGGEKNITNIDACASRLRVDVKDSSKVNKDGIISLGGASGALVKGQNVQVVYGGEQEAIKPRMIEILGIQRKGEKPTKAVSTTAEPIDTKKAASFVVLVDENMMANCPKCGQLFEVEMTKDSTKSKSHHTHSSGSKAKSSSTKKKVAKAKTATKKPVAKKLTAKKAAKPRPKKEETKEFVSGLKNKYQSSFDQAKEKNADKIKAEKNTKLRSQLDGSIDVTESRQELQKHVTALREQAKEEKITLAKGNLRDMTKKEVISYLSKALKKMDE